MICLPASFFGSSGSSYPGLPNCVAPVFRSPDRREDRCEQRPPKAQAAKESNQATPDCPEVSSDAKRSAGLLIGKEVGSVDFSAFRQDISLDELFGDGVSGAALLETMLMWFQDVELPSLPWYTQDGQIFNRNILRAPQSRAIQESTVSRYMSRIYSEGLSQVVSGPTFKWSLAFRVMAPSWSS